MHKLPATCELCQRTCEVEDPERAGWLLTWDGWLCPTHADENCEEI